MRKTANGAVTLSTTYNACVDLFAMVGAARNHPGQAVQQFERAYAENPGLALRIALWARDARGGAGERTTFRNILHSIERRNVDVITKLVSSGIIETLGRWDDLLGLQNAGWASVVEQVRVGFARRDRLMAKWLPRKGPVAAKLAKALGMDARTWRQSLTAMADTVEQRICAGEFGAIRYAAVPSVAAARYQHLFRKHDGERYASFLVDVAAGKTKMNAGVVFPHDVLKAAYVDDAAATVLWSQLPKPSLAGDALVMCDVSGSMGCRVSGQTSALDVCVSLGLLLSEVMPAPFTNQVLTFTSTPSWHTVAGSTLCERVNSLKSADWGMSTNIQAAFEAVLARALSADSSFKMPSALIVLSDMEFNRAGRHNKLNHEVAREKFEAAGFPLPTLVYWNLNGRIGNLPAGNIPGVVQVSGFSPKIAELVLRGNFDELTPESLMRAAVAGERYTVPGLTD